MHARSPNSCLASVSPGKSKPVPSLGSFLSVEKQWHLPSCQHPRSELFPVAVPLQPAGPRGALCCPPCRRRGGARQLLQEGFDLHCLVWLFKYRSECWGNFRHVYPLLWERLKTHVSSYSPAGLLCLCVHMQHTHTLRCGKLGWC